MFITGRRAARRTFVRRGPMYGNNSMIAFNDELNVEDVDEDWSKDYGCVEENI